MPACNEQDRGSKFALGREAADLDMGLDNESNGTEGFFMTAIMS